MLNKSNMNTLSKENLLASKAQNHSVLLPNNQTHSKFNLLTAGTASNECFQFDDLLKGLDR